MKEEEKPVKQLNLKRLAKNRESARNTRKKKKNQLELLEKQVAELTEHVEILRQKAKAAQNSCKTELTQKYKSDNQVLLCKLENLLAAHGSEEEFKEIIGILRAKMGANGVERQGYLEYLMRQISEFALPTQVKALLALENAKSTYFLEKSIDASHISSEAQGQIELHQTIIRKKSEEFSKIMKKLKRIEKCFLRRTGNLQNIIDDVSSRLSYSQIGALLVRINKESCGLEAWKDPNSK